MASKFISIGVIAFSLGLGFISFYLFSDITKEQKKIHVEELTSLLFNFIIFIWLGKIVINLPIFITDPLSVLAYPSDSKAFYIATIVIALSLLHKSRRRNLQITELLEPFIHVFLISSFVFEFMQLVVADNPFALGYLILSGILVSLFFFIREHTSSRTLFIVVVTSWSVGMLILAFNQPFVTVFGYIMSSWFIGLFFVTCMATYIYQLKKRATI